MHASDLSRQPYRRPPMSRATDPQRMNWLWRLVCEVADVRPAEVVEALHAAQVPVDLGRARSWVASDSEDNFFPVSMTEIERNLRAVLLLREAVRGVDELVGAGLGQAARDSAMAAAGLDDVNAEDRAFEAREDGIDEIDGHRPQDG